MSAGTGINKGIGVGKGMKKGRGRTMVGGGITEGCIGGFWGLWVTSVGVFDNVDLGPGKKFYFKLDVILISTATQLTIYGSCTFNENKIQILDFQYVNNIF